MNYVWGIVWLDPQKLAGSVDWSMVQTADLTSRDEMCSAVRGALLWT